MAQSFSAQIDDFIKLSEAKVEAVVKQSAQDLFEIAQKPVAAGGNMPVDTGFLRASLQTGLNGAGGAVGPDSYVAAIAGLELGDTVRGEWTAEYAGYVEYGTSRFAGRRFAGQAVAQWQNIVNANVNKVKSGGR